MRQSTILKIDKIVRFPMYDKTEKLYAKINKKPIHNGVGPDGFFSELIDWVMELHTYYIKNNQLLEYHWVPNIKGHSLSVLLYETNFLTQAIALWNMLDNTVTDIFFVRANRTHMYLLFDYAVVPTVNKLPALKIEQFIRPSK